MLYHGKISQHKCASVLAISFKERHNGNKPPQRIFPPKQSGVMKLNKQGCCTQWHFNYYYFNLLLAHSSGALAHVFEHSFCLERQTDSLSY